MLTQFLTAIAFVFSSAAPLQEQQELIFSGPQAGEKVERFAMTGVFGDEAYEAIDIVKRADGGPLLLMFVHERSRPAFGLSNALAKYAAAQKDKPLTCGICYLTGDSTEAMNWMKRIKQYFSPSVAVGISADGIEGPGSYGLNRNVALTILVINDDHVAANFALIQPALQADGQTVINAASKVLGAEPAPKITEFIPQRGRPPAGSQMNPELGAMLRRVIDKEATPEQVDNVAKKIEEYLVKNPKQKWLLGAACRRIVNGGKLATYGTNRAQQLIEVWSEKYVRLTDMPPANAKNAREMDDPVKKPGEKKQDQGKRK